MSSGNSNDGVRPDDIKAVPVRHPWRWVGAIVTLIVAASLINPAVSNPRIGWSTVGEYLFDSNVLDGVLMTVELTILCMIAGVVLGVIMAVLRLSSNPVLSGLSWLYIWFFRGLPRLVLILFVFFISALYPTITLGIPFVGPVLASFSANDVITGFIAGFLALSLSEGAYMAEIVRAGLISVDEGQTEAAQALGLSHIQTLRFVTLPQAMRVIVPPTGNETISMLKDTSLVSVIAVVDLLYSVQLIYARNYKQIPLLVVAIIWYLALTSVLYLIQYYIERRFGRGSSRNLPPTPRERLIALWRKWRPAAEVAS
jgi:polar amino acid transport system permease protein